MLGLPEVSKAWEGKHGRMKMFALAAVLAALTAGFAAAAQAETLAPVDQAVNAMLTAAGVANREASRVVPIVSAGGATTGYAQVVGPQARVASTRAVVMISSTSPNGWRIDTLVPVRVVSRTGGAMHREYGVAVDALVHGGE